MIASTVLNLGDNKNYDTHYIIIGKENHVRSIMSLPQVSATLSLSFNTSFVGYSGIFSKLKLKEGKSTHQL